MRINPLFQFLKLLLCFAPLYTGIHAALAAPANPAEQWLKPETISSEIAILKEAYSRIHPGYDRYTSEEVITAAWDAISERAQREDGLKLGDFYLEIEAVLVMIRCDHTKAEIPASLREFRTQHPIYLPFLWETVEQRGFISLVPSNSPFNFGDEILSIDGVALPELISEVSEYIPLDGYTEWSKRSGISQSLEFMGGAVDHFGSLLWDNKETVEIELRSPQGSTRSEKVSRMTYTSYRQLVDSQRSQQNFKDAVTFERLGDSAAYLRIDTFVNYRVPIKPATLFRPIFKAMEVEGRDNLILDLRKNGGGSTDAERSLLSFLIEKPLKTTKEMRVATVNLDGIRQYLSSYDSRALNPNRLFFRKNDDGSYSIRSWFAEELRTVRPARNAFDGNLIVLTSNDNSSASTNLISTLISHRQVTTIGEKTGGSPDGPTAGIIIMATLPHSGIRTRIPVIRTYNNTDGFTPGYGIEPDIEILKTVDNFLKKYDEALERAKQLVGVN